MPIIVIFFYIPAVKDQQDPIDPLYLELPQGFSEDELCGIVWLTAAICLDTEIEEGDSACRIASKDIETESCCKAEYHLSCIKKWFNVGKTQCPHCRIEIKRKSASNA